MAYRRTYRATRRRTAVRRAPARRSARAPARRSRAGVSRRAQTVRVVIEQAAPSAVARMPASAAMIGLAEAGKPQKARL